jgi:ankyrin repeat protein
MNSNLINAERAAIDGHWDEIEAMLDSSPGLEYEQDQSGRTLLLICARFGGSASTLRRLLDSGADPNHRAFDGSNAIAAAIVGGSKHGLSTCDELSTLLAYGADPNSVADSAMPALHWAVAQHRPAHLRVLLDHGARLDTLTSDDPAESIYDVARRAGCTECSRLLAEQNTGNLSI